MSESRDFYNEYLKARGQRKAEPMSEAAMRRRAKVFAKDMDTQIDSIVQYLEGADDQWDGRSMSDVDYLAALHSAILLSRFEEIMGHPLCSMEDGEDMEDMAKDLAASTFTILKHFANHRLAERGYED